MAEKSGFFDSHLVDGKYDRVYLAASFAKYFASFIGNGVFGGKSNELMVQQKTTADMSVRVLSGQAWINGYWYENEDEISLSIDVADGVLNRIDLIVLRWDNSERVIRLYVKKGTPATNAAAPRLQRDDDFYELGLAQIYVKAGAVSVTQSSITDTRLDNSLCGLVQGVIQQFDTTEFGKQIDTFIQEFEADNIAKMAAVLAKLDEMVESNDIASLILDVDALSSYFINGLLSIKNGGTGASTPSQARANLGAASAEAALQFQFNNLDGSVNYNNITTRGIYWVNTWSGTGGSNFPNGQDSGWMVVYAGADRSITQIYYSNLGYVLRRTRTDVGIFPAWEWENPPMKVGIEYCTTERFNGKPVYQYLAYDPTLPSTAGGESIDTALDFVDIISVVGVVRNKNTGVVYPTPMYFDGKSAPALVINKVTKDGWISSTITENMSNHELYVTIKYTKT